MRRNWDQGVTDAPIMVIPKRYGLGKRLAGPFLQLIVGHCRAQSQVEIPAVNPFRICVALG
jgi:hypothetical protein